LAVEKLSLSYEGQTVRLTASIGVAEYKPGQTINELINIADKLLYQAKNEGRNRVKYSDV